MATKHAHAQQIDNGRIVYTQLTDLIGTSPFRIYVMNEDGSGNYQLSPSSSDQAINALWAPDGKRVAYTRTHSSDPHQPDNELTSYLEVITANASATPTELTTSGKDVSLSSGHGSFVWSPDGTYIYYLHDVSLTQADIYRVKADGSGSPEAVLSIPGQSHMYIDISPDGSELAYDVCTTHCDYLGYSGSTVNIMNLQSHAIRQVADIAPQHVNQVQWSPDGSKLVIFGSLDTGGINDNNGGFGISFVNADGSNQHTAIAPSLNVYGSTNNTHVWSLDSSKVLYTQLNDAQTVASIMAVNATTSAITQITQPPAGDGDTFGNWSADGQKIVFARSQGLGTSSYIYSANVDGSNEQKLTGDGSVLTWFPDWETRLAPTSIVQNGETVTTVAPGENFSDQSFTVPDNTTFVNDGTTGDVTVQNGGTLKGHGSSGAVAIGSGGTVSPGNSPGCLSTNNFSIQTGGSYHFEVGGTTACTGYDQINVTGTVRLGSGKLDVAVVDGFAGSPGSNFVIIKNDGNDPVLGTFANQPEGSIVSANGLNFKISYVGGDGNDVTLTELTPPNTPDTGHAFLTANPLKNLAIAVAFTASLFVIGRVTKRAH